MVRAGQKIYNPVTGQRMRFLATATETEGSLLRIETVNPPTGAAEPLHLHPGQESSAEVVSGRLRFVVDGKEREVGAGESITIPAGVPHRFWNDGHEDAVAFQEFRPALRTAEFFEHWFGLAARGELGARGMPSLLHLAVIGCAFSDEVRVPSPPWPVQRLTYALLAPVARLRGIDVGA
jgi:quercetin dioxygenase-like cupin family protein